MLSLYNTDGQLVFDSAALYMRIEQFISVNYSSEFTPIDYPLSGSRQYAIAHASPATSNHEAFPPLPQGVYAQEDWSMQVVGQRTGNTLRFEAVQTVYSIQITDFSTIGDPPSTGFNNYWSPGTYMLIDVTGM
ncbi:hypothetical protein [Bordetella genomosp. 13]|uniref:hypothetical protein n=1 Tax=Bordetella genomosp. 13 TaxID=463040 RepID=UPI0011A66695|nr:hypothetical protein [Bordetella genomosp. 13]